MPHLIQEANVYYVDSKTLINYCYIMFVFKINLRSQAGHLVDSNVIKKQGKSIT
jgi:hypothetical protein